MSHPDLVILGRVELRFGLYRRPTPKWAVWELSRRERDVVVRWMSYLRRRQNRGRSFIYLRQRATRRRGGVTKFECVLYSREKVRAPQVVFRWGKSDAQMVNLGLVSENSEGYCYTGMMDLEGAVRDRLLGRERVWCTLFADIHYEEG